MDRPTAAAAIADALLLSHDRADQLAELLTPDDFAILSAIDGQPIAEAVVSQLVQLRQLQAAVQTMTDQAEAIQHAADLVPVRKGTAEQFTGGRFATTGELQAAIKRKPRTVKAYHAKTEDDGPRILPAAAPKQAAEASTAGELGELPEPADPARREAAIRDFPTFLRTYFPAAFDTPFEADQREALALVQKAIHDGGLHSRGMFRGRGSTSYLTRAALYAVLTGRHKLAVMYAGTRDRAEMMLETIAAELQGNDLLTFDFPEVCLPFRALGESRKRCYAQTYRGEKTEIFIAGDRLRFPVIPGSPASGAAIYARGIQSRRDTKFEMGGHLVRPSLALFDDPLSFTGEEAARKNAYAEMRRLAHNAGAAVHLFAFEGAGAVWFPDLFT